jgi:uncharacterized membrane protein
MPRSRSEPPIVKNIRTIAELEKARLAERSRFQCFCDAISTYAGSIWSVALHAFWFAGWLLYNTLGNGFDPYPFPLLTLVVSLEAIFLSLFILMSQNLENKMMERRAHFDLQINLLAEAEATQIMKMLRALCAAHKLPEAKDPEIAALQKETDPAEVIRDLDRAMAERSTQ